MKLNREEAISILEAYNTTFDRYTPNEIDKRVIRRVFRVFPNLKEDHKYLWDISKPERKKRATSESE